jgi:hypothetical protein
MNMKLLASVIFTGALTGCASSAQINPQVSVDTGDKSDVVSLGGNKYQVLRKGSAEQTELKRSAGVAAGKTCVALGKKVLIDKEDTDVDYTSVFLFSIETNSVLTTFTCE